MPSFSASFQPPAYQAQVIDFASASPIVFMLDGGRSGGAT